MASNELTIKITGDESDLNKALADASKSVKKFAETTTGDGRAAGVNFGAFFGDGARSKLRDVVGSFREVQNVAQGGFLAIGEAFIATVVNPVTLGAAAIGASIFAAFQFAKIGEQNEKISKSFERFATDAGLNADFLKGKIAEVAEGYIDLEDVLPRAGEAILALGVNANKLPEILSLARNIAVQTGRDTGQVFDELTKGIENQNIKLLRNNSIRLDGAKVLEDYAKAQGVTVNQLSEAAKQQAFLNAALEQGAKKFGQVGAESAPIEGGIKKLGLAFDDLKDAIAQVVNSNLGVFFADVLKGAASATKAVAEFFTPEKTEAEMSLPERIAKTNAEIATLANQLSRARLDAPYIVESLNKQLLEANTKLTSLTAAQAALEEQNARASNLAPNQVTGGETDEQIAARLEKERQKQADLLAIRAESDALELQRLSDNELARQAIEAGGNTNTQAMRQAATDAQILRNESEYQSALEKNKKIADLEQRNAADEIALKKKQLADDRALNAQKVTDARLTADAKIQIENNLFSAAKMLVDQQSALGKTIAVAEAIRNTYRGATLALATYPPPFGFAAAASTVALGLAQVAKITAANTGALVTTGQPGQDTNPFLLSRGEIVAPAKSFDEVVEGTARQRGFVKAGEASMNAELLKQIADKIGTPSVSITVNTDVIADQNGINTLVERIRDAIDFNAAPSLA